MGNASHSWYSHVTKKPGGMPLRNFQKALAGQADLGVQENNKFE